MLRKILSLIIAIAIPLIGGFLVSRATRNAVLSFGELNKPPLSPPAAVFPIAWTILYILMGIGSYLVINKITNESARAWGVVLYIIQLGLNFGWSFVFFNMQKYIVAFMVLLLLWIAVFLMMKAYKKVSLLAFIITIPYIAWLTFAGYLNIGIALLN